MCWVPESSYLTERSASDQTLVIRPCLTDASSKCMARHLLLNITVFIDVPEVTDCKKPCSENQYIFQQRWVNCVSWTYTANWTNVSVREDRTTVSEDGTSFVYLFYQNLVVPIEEEYLLFDFNSIVSAVGGSLSLFLGFSCYELVKRCLNKLTEAGTTGTRQSKDEAVKRRGRQKRIGRRGQVRPQRNSLTSIEIWGLFLLGLLFICHLYPINCD